MSWVTLLLTPLVLLASTARARAQHAGTGPDIEVPILVLEEADDQVIDAAAEDDLTQIVLSAAKRLAPVQGATTDGAPFAGYEMHMGVTDGPDRARPFAQLADGKPEGAVSPNGLVAGTYVHGLFADDRQRSAWLQRLGAGPAATAHEATVETVLDRLAAHIAGHVDLDRLLSLSR